MSALKPGRSVLIVDDTSIYRQVFKRAVEQIPAVSRVDAVNNGRDALKKVTAEAYDLVICDLIMPDMDGLETLVAILEERPTQPIVVVSGVSGRDCDITVKALSQGALDFVEKPRGGDMTANMNQLTASFLRLLRTASVARPAARKPASPAPKIARKAAPPAPTPSAKSGSRLSPIQSLAIGTPGLLLVGVSTGGPNALQKLLPSLPKNFPVPIALVQHMPAGFTATLAAQLDSACELKVREAVQGDVLQPGSVYIAPGGKHMTLRVSGDNQLTCDMNDDPPVNSCRPAVDVLFKSVAASRYSRSIVSVILTGMGNDGADGVEALKKGKCVSLTQSAESCVIYGMPKAVDDRGLADESVPLDELADRILSWIMPSRAAAKTA